MADSVDAFPLDPLESRDSDNDGIGDNADAFPQNADESRDSDGDGVGDREDAYPFNPDEYLAWGERNHLEPVITRAQAATIRITSSTGVIIAPRYAITAAHSPLDGNNEITPNLIAENAWGEQRRIVDVLYDVQRDFAIVEFEEPFEKFGTVPLATEAPPTGSEAFVVGNPGYAVASQLTRSVSFGTVTNYLEPDGFERFSDFHIYGVIQEAAFTTSRGSCWVSSVWRDHLITLLSMILTSLSTTLRLICISWRTSTQFL